MPFLKKNHIKTTNTCANDRQKESHLGVVYPLADVTTAYTKLRFDVDMPFTQVHVFQANCTCLKSQSETFLVCVLCCLYEPPACSPIPHIKQSNITRSICIADDFSFVKVILPAQVVKFLYKYSRKREECKNANILQKLYAYTSNCCNSVSDWCFVSKCLNAGNIMRHFSPLLSITITDSEMILLLLDFKMARL